MIFVDTAAWAAITLSNDRYHKAATRYQKELRRKREILITTNFILDETRTLLLYHAGYVSAVRFFNLLQIMLAGRITRVFHVSQEIENQAWQIFKKFNIDKEWSFTDCTSKAVMDAMNVSEVFTFDHHFDQMGFVCVPGPIGFSM